MTSKPSHEGIVCTQCRKEIRGNRYQCKTKSHFGINYCSPCFEQRKKPGRSYGEENWEIWSSPGVSAGKISEAPIHKGTICGGCKMKPISGQLYECLTKDKFWFCTACWISRGQKGMANQDWAKYQKPGKIIEYSMQREHEHPDVKCFTCKMDPLKGDRYKCLTKDKIDLCHYCFNARNDKGLFYDIKWMKYHQPSDNGVEIPAPKKSSGDFREGPCPSFSCGPTKKGGGKKK